MLNDNDDDYDYDEAKPLHFLIFWSKLEYTHAAATEFLNIRFSFSMYMTSYDKINNVQL